MHKGFASVLNLIPTGCLTMITLSQINLSLLNNLGIYCSALTSKVVYMKNLLDY